MCGASASLHENQGRIGLTITRLVCCLVAGAITASPAAGQDAVQATGTDTLVAL